MDARHLRTACEKTIRVLLQAPFRFTRETRGMQAGSEVYRLAGGAVDVRVCVAIRGRLRPGDLAQLAAVGPANACDHRLVFADYVTPPVAEKLKQSGIWYADAQGNVFLSVPGALLLQVAGNRPARVAAPKGQHFSAPGAKVLHHLLKHGPRVRATYRDIRGTVGVSIDKIGKVVRELEAARALRVHGRGDVEILDGDRLLRLWTDAFAAKLLPELRIGRFAAADGFDPGALLRQAEKALGSAFVVGHEVAADAWTGHLRPGSLRLYIPEERTAAVLKDLRLAPTNAGRIELCRLYADGIRGEKRIGNTAIADPAFVYGELTAADDDRLADTAHRLREERLAWTL